MNKNDIAKDSENEQHNYLAALKDFEHKMEDMFQRLWQNPFHHDKTPDIFSNASFGNMPSMDVIDRDKEILVKAELPGFDKKDLDISITDRQLVIKAKTCEESKEEKGDYLRQEISQNEIYRSVLLPDDVDDSKVKTSFKNGVLELNIPKQKNSHRRRIEIK